MEANLLNGLNMTECWKEIGVTGDRSCPKLPTYIHCRNCPVYSEAGRSLLERHAPDAYIDNWTELLAQTQPATTKGTLETETQAKRETKSVIIFRLGEELLALPVWVFKEVTAPSVIHTIPHRSDEILLGLVNIRGEILLCVSLQNFLGITPANTESSFYQKGVNKQPILSQKLYSVASQRMVVVETGENRFAFIVDEISSVQRFQLTEFKAAPAVISQVKDTYTKSIVNFKDKKVNCLDYELLFYTLHRRIL